MIITKRFFRVDIPPYVLSGWVGSVGQGLFNIMYIIFWGHLCRPGFSPGHRFICPSEYNAHYVNIALGGFFWRAFCFLGLERLFAFLFLPIKKFQLKNKKAKCRKCEGTKSLTVKTTKGRQGKGKKDRKNAAKQPLIYFILFSGMAGFFALWSGWVVGLIFCFMFWR